MGGGKNKKEANRSPFSRIYALFHSGFSIGKKMSSRYPFPNLKSNTMKNTLQM